VGDQAAQLCRIAAAVLRPGARDVSGFGAAVPGQFARLVRDLDRRARRGQRIGFVTGAYMAWAEPPAAETDGPVGVAVLARALADLGADPVVLTDGPCADVVRAALGTVGLTGALSVVPVTATEAQVAECVRLLQLDRVVAVERLGPGVDGRVRTMRGVDITGVTAPLHAAFSVPGVATAAIGDGGNEIGMGNVPLELVAAAVDLADVIACRVQVDDLVPAGASNWGCYGVLAGLAAVAGDDRARLLRLLDPAVDEAVLAACAAAGGIDGVRGRVAPSVDGVPTADYRELLVTLAELASEPSAAAAPRPGRSSWAPAVGPRLSTCLGSVALPASPAGCARRACG
jgi:hypothetical protein